MGWFLGVFMVIWVLFIVFNIFGKFCFCLNLFIMFWCLLVEGRMINICFRLLIKMFVIFVWYLIIEDLVILNLFDMLWMLFWVVKYYRVINKCLFVEINFFFLVYLGFKCWKLVIFLYKYLNVVLEIWKNCWKLFRL